jgi:pimeloyl-ACP methyl ester carboxylesterase
MADLGRGRIGANGITFEYLEAGEGPLALCMHGFPDSPFTYRHLLPAPSRPGAGAASPTPRPPAASRAARPPPSS